MRDDEKLVEPTHHRAVNRNQSFSRVQVLGVDLETHEVVLGDGILDEERQGVAI